MYKSRILTMALVTSMTALSSGCGVIAYAREAEVAQAPAVIIRETAPKAEHTTPDLVVQSFYSWYLSYASGAEGRNPMVDGAYRDRPELSADLVAEMDALLNGPDRVNYDPFLQAQDVPGSFELHEVVMDGDSARVVLSTDFAGHVLAIDLVRHDGAWLIDEIGRADVPEVSAEADLGARLSGAEQGAQAFYDWYLTFLSESEGEGGPPSLLNDGAYKRCPYLAPSFIEELAAQLDSGEPLMADPFLCAQDIPDWVRVEQAVEARNAVQLTMVSSFSEHRFNVFMREMTPGQWLVDGVQPVVD